MSFTSTQCYRVTLVIITVKKRHEKSKKYKLYFYSPVNKQTKTTFLAEVYITTTKIPVTRSPGSQVANHSWFSFLSSNQHVDTNKIILHT